MVALSALSTSKPDLDTGSDWGISRTDDITAAQVLTLTGRAIAGATIAIYDGDLRLGTTVAAAGGSWAFRTPTLTEGQHAFSTIVTDADGNTSAPSDRLVVTIDTTPPTTPAAPDLDAGSDWGASATDNITDRYASLVLTGTAEANAAIQVTADPTTGLRTWSAHADATGAWSCQLLGPLLTRGVHSFTVSVMDAAGNWSLWSPALKVTLVDRGVAPGAPDLAAGSDTGMSDHDHVTASRSIVVTGKAAAGRLVEVFREGPAGDFQQLGTVRAGTDGAWALTTTPLADGVHEFWTRVLDNAGIASDPGGSLFVTIDTTAPQAPGSLLLAIGSDTGASASDNITAEARPVFTGTAEAGTRITLYDEAVAIGTAAAAADGTWQIAAGRALAAGTHTMTARATDLAGNTGTATGLDVTVVIPPTAPAAPDLATGSDSGLSATDNITRARSPVLEGVTTPGQLIAIYDGNTRLGSALASATGAWTFRTPALADGPHRLTACLVAAGGIEGAHSAPLDIVIDTAAPAAPTPPALAGMLFTATADGANTTNLTSPVLTGTAEAGATVTIYRGTSVIGTILAGIDGSWSFAPPAGLDDGTHALRVRATDAAGNVSVGSAPLTLCVDTCAPCAPAITSYTPTRIAGTAEAGTTVALSDGDTLLGTTTVSRTGTWAITGDFTDQAYAALSAISIDRAGNTAASAPVAVTLGTAGNDLLDGTTHGGLLVGVAGDDTYEIGAGTDVTILERPGQGLDTILASADYTLASGCSIEFLTAVGSSPLVLTGNEQRNVIQGGTGDDTIRGGGGRDTLYGGLGADRFVLATLADSTTDPADRDLIADFSRAQGDLLDLSRLDADLGTPGDQGFTFIGAAPFHGVAGELDTTRAGATVTVWGDVDGDGLADFAIGLRGVSSLAASDFVL